MSHGLVVVGGGPAGYEAARAFREVDSESPVVIISADHFPPYARPPLTKDYLRGESGADDLPLAEASWYPDHRVELQLACRVSAVDVRNRQVSSDDGTTRHYDRLVLATGSDPKHLPVPGGDHPGVIYVRDRTSAERLRALADRSGRVAVIGSGFIGCEVAASLASRGTPVILVTDEQVPHAARLGEGAGNQIRSWLTDAEVELRTGSGVAAVEPRRSGWRVVLQDDSFLDVDDVVCGGGATPNVQLAEAAGLRMSEGGVRTDASLRTSDPGVLAAGDIAYALNSAAGRELRVEHWGEAEAHGAIAGAVAAGEHRTWSSAPGFWSGIGDRTLKYTAWGDGHDDWTMTGSSDSWVVWYRSGRELSGVLTYNDDDAYEQGQEMIENKIAFNDAVPRS